MRRTEAPPLATWLLEHGIPGDYDEALAGDLLEEFRSGRSDGWFWRQVLAACAVSWGRSLRARIPLFVFALIWSMMAPAWKVFTDGIESALSIDRILQSFGPVWVFAALAVWLLLNSIFLWAGISVFVLFQAGLREVFRGKMLRRAFLLASLIFLPIYGVTWVWGSLYWYSFFANTKMATTPLGQIADLQMLSGAIRLPYFIALFAALWSAVPQSIRTSQLQLVDSPPIESSTPYDSLQPESTLGVYTVKRFFGLMVGAGLINAMLAGILLCRLPGFYSPTFSTLLVRSILHIVIGVIAGVGGSWLYWKNPSSPIRERSPIPFPLFALICASGWIWVPPMAIFSEQLSPATAIVAAIGAGFLAIGLRYATFSVFAPAVPAASYESEDDELFSQSLYRAPWEAQGYVITFLLYAGGCALAMRLNLIAAALFALCAFLFAWNRTFARDQDLDARREYKRAALRLALVFIPAILVTIWALLDGVAHRNYIAGVNAARSTAEAASANEDASEQTKSPPSATGISGYQSVILWPVPEKKRILPPLPPQPSFLAHGTTKPLIIKFDGPYWYFQPPHKGPSPRAFQVRGTPLVHDFQTNNFASLIMEAHQTLGTSIPLARCREIQVGLLNSDNRRGIINLAVLLADSSSPGRSQLYIGQQPVASSLPANFGFKSKPAGETLRFPIPNPAKIRKFDQITVMFFPDASNYDIGPKVAIDQFQLIPR